jgi:peptidoglycan/xylan/chitin deacetylase (PgdA/CDA1 family)
MPDNEDVPRSPPRAKDRLFDLAFKGVVWSGAHHWARSIGQGRGVILTMHHVRPESAGAFATNQLLEITPQFLDAVLGHCRSQGYDLVSLDQVPSLLAGTSSDRFFVALTFDDGYRDTLAHAMPVLARHGAPWTMFVCTGFAERTAMLWWLELEAAIRSLPAIRLELPDGVFAATLATTSQKMAAFDALYWRLRRLPEASMLATIATLAAQAGNDWRARVERLCLSWDEIVAVSGAPGVTIGAHTLTHPILSQLPEADAREEITASRARIAERLGQPIRHLAYPVGDSAAAGSREVAMAKAAGFATAVTTRSGHLWPDHAGQMQALPRVSLNGFHQNLTALKALLSGLPFLALNRGRMAR